MKRALFLLLFLIVAIVPGRAQLQPLLTTDTPNSGRIKLNANDQLLLDSIAVHRAALVGAGTDLVKNGATLALNDTITQNLSVLGTLQKVLAPTILNPGRSRSDGSVYISDSTEGTTPHGLLNVNRYGPASYNALDDLGAFKAQAFVNSTMPTQPATMVGIKGRVEVRPGGDYAPGQIIAGEFQADYKSNDTIANVNALVGSVIMNQGTATSRMSVATGIRVPAHSKVLGTAGDAFGVYLADQTIGDTENAAIRLETGGRISWNNDVDVQRVSAGTLQLNGTLYTDETRISGVAVIGSLGIPTGNTQLSLIALDATPFLWVARQTSGTRPQTILYNFADSAYLYGTKRMSFGSPSAISFSQTDDPDGGTSPVRIDRSLLLKPYLSPIDSVKVNGTAFEIYSGGNVFSTEDGPAGSGITSLNGLTAGTQTFATGTAGTDFAISSLTSTHTFNIPSSSASNRGLLTSTDWTTFNGKLGAALTSANIFVGNGSNVATGVAVTGDVSISNAGVTAIGSGVIVNADINAAAAIDLSKLATDPLARANHTGTQAFSTITSTPTTLSGYGITDALSNSASSTQNGAFGNISLFDDTTPSHYLTFTVAENLTAARTLSIVTGDASRTLTFAGNATISGTNSGDQTITLTGDVTGTGTGSFATTIAAGAVDIAMHSATGTPSATTFYRGDNTWATPAGSGDMVLAGTQENTGPKTFLDNTLLMRNVANTFSSDFTNTNTAARSYTLPDKDMTVAGTDDFFTTVGAVDTRVVVFTSATEVTGDADFTFDDLTNTLNSTVITEAGNAVPNATDHLGFFAATTSAQLFGVLSDESGAVGVVPRFSLTAAAQGDLAFYNGTNWVNLAPGTSGLFLQTQGAAANPIWAAPAGGGTVTHTGGALTLDLPLLGAGGDDIKTSTAANMRSVLLLVPGVDVQGFDDDLTTWSTIAPAAGIGAWLATPSGANLATALTTALPASKGGTGLTALGTGVPTALGIDVGLAGAFITFNGAGGTPSSLTLTNATELPITTGVSGLGANVATFLATPSSANLAAAVTGETGSGAAVFGTSPDFTTGATIGGVAIPTISSTSTLTNKRWTARVGSTTSSATPTINTDDVDIYKLTAQAVDITSMTTNLSGTPVDGDILEVQITGTAARAITFGASFVASTVALPTTTVTTATLSVVFQFFVTSSYGANKWVCVNSF